MRNDVAYCVSLQLFDVLNVFSLLPGREKESACERGYVDLMELRHAHQSLFAQMEVSFLLSDRKICFFSEVIGHTVAS